MRKWSKGMRIISFLRQNVLEVIVFINILSIIALSCPPDRVTIKDLGVVLMLAAGYILYVARE